MVSFDDFRKMWEDDGFQLVELDSREQDDLLWKLFHVTSPYLTADYGRHLVMILVIDKKTKEILAHDMKNQDLFQINEMQWFERHVRVGLNLE